MNHELKILPIYFNDIKKGLKNFELRKNKNFKIGDKIILKEHNKKKYTGREIIKEIKYILKDVPQYGLKSKYVILSFND